MSFAKEIREWLGRCAALAWSVPVISGTIQQYIDLLEKLTDGKRESGFEKMMEDLIGSSRASFESALEIADALPAVKTKMLLRVFREIERHVNRRLEWDYSDYEEVCGHYYTKRGEMIPCVIYPIAAVDNFSLAVEFGVEWNLYMGFGLWNNDGGFEREATDELASALQHKGWASWICSFRHKPGETWWKLLPEQTPLNFKECTGIYPELYDADRYDAILGQVFAEIDDCIANLEEMGILPPKHEFSRGEIP